MIPALYFYRRDKVRRIAGGLIPAQKKVPLSLLEIILLLLAGAGLAQYGNFLMAILQSFINSSAYQESITSYDDFLDGNYCTCGGGNDLPLVNLSASA